MAAMHVPTSNTVRVNHRLSTQARRAGPPSSFRACSSAATVDHRGTGTCTLTRRSETCAFRQRPQHLFAKGRRAPGARRAEGARCALAEDVGLSQPGAQREDVSVVMKFGGSSVRDAERMREVANIICEFTDELPCIVLSAMGVTTNNLLAAGEEALQSQPKEVSQIAAFQAIVELHHNTLDELQIEEDVRLEVCALLEELEMLLSGIAIMKELTSKTRAQLVSFGERMSTRIFAAYLRVNGVSAKQYDAWDIGFVSTEDNHEYGEIMPETYPNVKEALSGVGREGPILPIVTGFLAKGHASGTITTLGRGGSDLSATVIGAALEVPEVQVWKDVDGVLSADPRLVPMARPVPALTFEEATELAYFGAKVLHPHAMRPAMDSQSLSVRVKNSYNVHSPGTVITADKEASESLLTSIVLKEGVTMLDIVSTRMLGQYGFLAKVFDVMQKHKISVDVVATSEVSVSLTLDPSKIWSRDLIKEELDSLEADLKRVARLEVKKNHSILSLIGDVKRSSIILEKAFGVLAQHDINVIMMSQGASKVNISLIVEEQDGTKALAALHDSFFS